MGQWQRIHLQYKSHRTCRFNSWVVKTLWEGNGNPLQYSGLETLMDGSAWWAAAHGVTKVRHNWTYIHNLQEVSWECCTIRKRGKPALHFFWRLCGRICFLAFWASGDCLHFLAHGYVLHLPIFLWLSFPCLLLMGIFVLTLVHMNNTE